MPDSNDPDDVIKSSTTLLKVFLRILKILVRKPKAAKKLFVSDTHTSRAASEYMQRPFFWKPEHHTKPSLKT